MHIKALKRGFIALAAGASLQAQAVVHKIDVGTELPRFSLVKEGTHRYLRFFHKGEANTPLDIWARETSFVEKDGRKLMRIRQRWDAVGATPSVKLLDSWFEPGTFRPISHERITDKDGKRVVEGFEFQRERVVGMAALKDNAQKDLAVVADEPTFNFETDIEFLQALPLAEGYEAHINFYHPGGPAKPQRYTFKVAGSETIAGPAGPVECWVVTTDYNNPGSVARFWFAKGSQLMLRQESVRGDTKLVKTLID
jgi:hypothetical protein